MRLNKSKAVLAPLLWALFVCNVVASWKRKVHDKTCKHVGWVPCMPCDELVLVRCDRGLFWQVSTLVALRSDSPSLRIYVSMHIYVLTIMWTFKLHCLHVCCFSVIAPSLEWVWVWYASKQVFLLSVGKCCDQHRVSVVLMKTSAIMTRRACSRESYQ